MTSREAPTSRLATLTLSALLLLQVVVGALYIERTPLRDGPADAQQRVYVLWDDAMISMRYARNLAAGEGFVWNPNGERVQGYTNLGLTLVMAAVHALPIPVERTALWIQGLALGCLLGIALLAAALVFRVTSNAWAAAGAVFALLLCSPYQIYALQGSDTIFVSLLLLAGCARLLPSGRTGGAGDYRIDGLIPLLFAVLVRPDASLFVACTAGVIATLPDSRGRRLALAPVFLLTAVWIGLTTFSLLYYGDPLPNTWYLKATGTPISMMLASGFEQLASFGLYALPALLVAALFAPRVLQGSTDKPDTQRVFALLGSFVVVGSAYHVWVGGDWMRDYGSRHLVQQLPALIVLAAIGTAQLSRIAGARFEVLSGPAAQAALSVGGLLVIGATLNPQAPAREWFSREAPTLLHAENQGNFDRARFLAKATQPDTTVAAHWAGIGPYFAERESLDVLGRSDKHIARMQVDRFIAGHSKWDWNYVLESRKPDIIDFESRGLRNHPRFRSDYAALVLGPKKFLFVRKDARNKILDPSLGSAPVERIFGPLQTDASNKN
ncbi:MAG: hypothetical protein VX246_02960 [Myxococcota bacterium]|nr:hypothetical protein [Myxococcota bacterium]